MGKVERQKYEGSWLDKFTKKVKGMLPKKDEPLEEKVESEELPKGTEPVKEAPPHKPDTDKEIKPETPEYKPNIPETVAEKSEKLAEMVGIDPKTVSSEPKSMDSILEQYKPTEETVTPEQKKKYKKIVSIKMDVSAKVDDYPEIAKVINTADKTIDTIARLYSDIDESLLLLYSDPDEPMTNVELLRNDLAKIKGDESSVGEVIDKIQNVLAFYQLKSKLNHKKEKEKIRHMIEEYHKPGESGFKSHPDVARHCDFLAGMLIEPHNRVYSDHVNGVLEFYYGVCSVLDRQGKTSDEFVETVKESYNDESSDIKKMCDDLVAKYHQLYKVDNNKTHMTVPETELNKFFSKKKLIENLEHIKNFNENIKGLDHLIKSDDELEDDRAYKRLLWLEKRLDSAYTYNMGYAHLDRCVADIRKPLEQEKTLERDINFACDPRCTILLRDPKTLEDYSE